MLGQRRPGAHVPTRMETHPALLGQGDARAVEAWSSRAHEGGDPPCSSGAGVLAVGRPAESKACSVVKDEVTLRGSHLVAPYPTY